MSYLDFSVTVDYFSSLEFILFCEHLRSELLASEIKNIVPYNKETVMLNLCDHSHTHNSTQPDI